MFWNSLPVPPKDKPLWVRAVLGEATLALASPSRGSVVTHKAPGLWGPLPEPGHPCVSTCWGLWGGWLPHACVLSCPGVLLSSCLWCLMVAVLRLYP